MIESARDLSRLKVARPRLLRWYRRHRRDLPWRRTRDPYAIWVSEVMLQQTRVETVVPYYGRFLARFPTLSDLASSREEDVLAAWSGLGYYRRARMLREGASAVMERHGGRVPDDPALLLTLPGVGRYTAGAIASICFARAAAVLDGNVERVLGRWLALEDPPGSRRTRDLWNVAESLLPRRSVADWNQALMELGATVCTPKAPDCPACPVRTACAAHAKGRPAGYPPARPAERGERLDVSVAVCLSRGRVLLERPSTESPLRGTWDLPARATPGTDGATPLRTMLRRGLAIRVGPGTFIGRFPHAILRHRLRLSAWRFEFPGVVRNAGRWRWVDLGRLDRVAVSGATRKIVGALGTVQGPSHGTRGRSNA